METEKDLMNTDYLCGDCDSVFYLPSAAAPVCQACGGTESIFARQEDGASGGAAPRPPAPAKRDFGAGDALMLLAVAACCTGLFFYSNGKVAAAEMMSMQTPGAVVQKRTLDPVVTIKANRDCDVRWKERGGELSSWHTITCKAADEAVARNGQLDVVFVPPDGDEYPHPYEDSRWFDRLLSILWLVVGAGASLMLLAGLLPSSTDGRRESDA